MSNIRHQFQPFKPINLSRHAAKATCMICGKEKSLVDMYYLGSLHDSTRDLKFFGCKSHK